MELEQIFNQLSEHNKDIMLMVANSMLVAQNVPAPVKKEDSDKKQ